MSSATLNTAAWQHIRNTRVQQAHAPRSRGDTHRPDSLKARKIRSRRSTRKMDVELTESFCNARPTYLHNRQYSTVHEYILEMRGAPRGRQQAHTPCSCPCGRPCAVQGTGRASTGGGLTHQGTMLTRSMMFSGCMTNLRREKGQVKNLRVYHKGFRGAQHDGGCRALVMHACMGEHESLRTLQGEANQARSPYEVVSGKELHTDGLHQLKGLVRSFLLIEAARGKAGCGRDRVGGDRTRGVRPQGVEHMAVQSRLPLLQPSFILAGGASARSHIP